MFTKFSQDLEKLLFAADSKHTSFWPSADVKPVKIDLVHAMFWQCMFALSMCRLQYLWMLFIDISLNRLTNCGYCLYCKSLSKHKLTTSARFSDYHSTAF